LRLNVKIDNIVNIYKAIGEVFQKTLGNMGNMSVRISSKKYEKYTNNSFFYEDAKYYKMLNNVNIGKIFFNKHSISSNKNNFYCL